MSTIKTTHLQHPSASSPNLTLAADGSVSGGAGLGGLVHIATESFSGVSSVSLDGCFTSTYNTYRVMIAITGLSTDLGLSLRMRASGSDDSTTNYFYQYLTGSGSTAGAAGNSTQTSWDLGSIDGVNSNFRYVATMDFYGPEAATRTQIIGIRGRNDSTGTANVQSTWNYHIASTQFDGFTLSTNTGNITGTIRVYGYKD